MAEEIIQTKIPERYYKIWKLSQNESLQEFTTTGLDIQTFIENAVNNRARKAIDYFCDLEGVSKRASDSTKNTTITNATIETVEDRNKRLGVE